MSGEGEEPGWPSWRYEEEADHGRPQRSNGASSTTGRRRGGSRGNLAPSTSRKMATTQLLLRNAGVREDVRDLEAVHPRIPVDPDRSGGGRGRLRLLLLQLRWRLRGIFFDLGLGEREDVRQERRDARQLPCCAAYISHLK